MSTSNVELRTMHVAAADRMGFSVVNALVIALLLWVDSTLNESQIEVAELKVEITQLRGDMKHSLDEDYSQRTRLIKAENDIADLKARLNAREH